MEDKEAMRQVPFFLCLYLLLKLTLCNGYQYEHQINNGNCTELDVISAEKIVWIFK